MKHVEGVQELMTELNSWLERSHFENECNFSVAGRACRAPSADGPAAASHTQKVSELLLWFR